MKTALLQVKEELGADAVIMSNKKVAGGVEIVAAVDGDTPAPKGASNRYAAQPAREPVSRPAAKPAPAPARASSRELEDDRVSLKGGAEQGRSMTQRFANMLKQYSNTQVNHGDDDDRGQNEETDSLTALLRRQAEQRQGNGPISRYSESPALSRSGDSSDDTRGRQTPKLDPTRFERSRRDQEATIAAEELESMREEMESIRRLLEHQVSGLMWQEVERREPLRAMLIRRLERMGVSLDLADQLACYIPEETPPPKAWKALLRLVADQVPISKQDILKRGGVVALLGPTGVGKTTTVAKLAARAAMEYGSDNVALVTTDTYRIGAHEQLSIYGRIMGCPVKVAKDSKELADVISQLRNRRLILVDTAGMGQRDVRLSEQLDTLMQESGEVIHSYLVLPATAQRKVLQETIEHFRRIPLSGCIMTKLDECLSLGEFVSVVVQNALPVAYIANGQRVPEDIVIAQPKYMVSKANELLEKSTENEPHYWASDVEKF